MVTKNDYRLWLAYRRGELSKRQIKGLTTRDRMSIRCSDFAAYLLIPTEALRKSLRAQGVTARLLLWRLPYTRRIRIRAMAEQFKVPYEVMYVRLIMEAAKEPRLLWD